MTIKTLKYYFVGSLLVVFTFFITVEFVTRTVSWAAGKGFTLALHEFDPVDSDILDIYQWHPFTGFTFRPNMTFIGSHPYQKETVKVFTDQYGFLTKDGLLTQKKDANEVRIATIGASTTANVSLEFDENW